VPLLSYGRLGWQTLLLPPAPRRVSPADGCMREDRSVCRWVLSAVSSSPAVSSAFLRSAVLFRAAFTRRFTRWDARTPAALAKLCACAAGGLHAQRRLLPFLLQPCTTLPVLASTLQLHAHATCLGSAALLTLPRLLSFMPFFAYAPRWRMPAALHSAATAGAGILLSLSASEQRVPLACGVSVLRSCWRLLAWRARPNTSQEALFQTVQWVPPSAMPCLLLLQCLPSLPLRMQRKALLGCSASGHPHRWWLPYNAGASKYY